MSGSYTKVEELAAAIFERESRRETNRQFAKSYGLTQRQTVQLANRQNRKRKKLETRLIILPKGHPLKAEQAPEAAQ